MIGKKACFPHFELLRFDSDHKILSGSFLWVEQSDLYRKDSGTSKPYLYPGGKKAFSLDYLFLLMLHFYFSRLLSSTAAP